MGFPEQELVVTGKVSSVEDGIAVVACGCEQGGKRIVRNAEAELRIADA
jgi:hypothetical protein